MELHLQKNRERVLATHNKAHYGRLLSQSNAPNGKSIQVDPTLYPGLAPSLQAPGVAAVGAGAQLQTKLDKVFASNMLTVTTSSSSDVGVIALGGAPAELWNSKLPSDDLKLGCLEGTSGEGRDGQVGTVSVMSGEFLEVLKRTDGWVSRKTVNIEGAEWTMGDTVIVRFGTISDGTKQFGVLLDVEFVPCSDAGLVSGPALQELMSLLCNSAGVNVLTVGSKPGKQSNLTTGRPGNETSAERFPQLGEGDMDAYGYGGNEQYSLAHLAVQYYHLLLSARVFNPAPLPPSMDDANAVPAALGPPPSLPDPAALVASLTST